jgi:hypothetical protein
VGVGVGVKIGGISVSMGIAGTEVIIVKKRKVRCRSDFRSTHESARAVSIDGCQNP